MGDNKNHHNENFNYFMKKQDRRSIKNAEKTNKKRLLSFGVIFFDIILIVMLFGIIFRPQIEHLDNIEIETEKNLMDELTTVELENLNIVFSLIEGKKDITIDLYVINKLEKDIVVEPDNFYITLSSMDKKFKSKFKPFDVSSKKGKHIPITIDKKDQSSFWFTCFYKDNEIYQSETIKLGN